MSVSSALLSALQTSVRVVDNRLDRLELQSKKRKLGLREERERSLEFISRVFDCDARAFLRELEGSTFRVEYRRRLAQLDSEIPGHRVIHPRSSIAKTWTSRSGPPGRASSSKQEFCSAHFPPTSWKRCLVAEKAR